MLTQNNKELNEIIIGIVRNFEKATKVKSRMNPVQLKKVCATAFSYMVEIDEINDYIAPAREMNHIQWTAFAQQYLVAATYTKIKKNYKSEATDQQAHIASLKEVFTGIHEDHEITQKIQLFSADQMDEIYDKAISKAAAYFFKYYEVLTDIGALEMAKGIEIGWLDTTLIAIYKMHMADETVNFIKTKLEKSN